ncbi:hypothetical protein [Rhodoglobus sp.]
MTTFHDPPPQSRRAARQSERERAADEQPSVEGFTTFPSQEAEENSVEEPHKDLSADTTAAAAPSGTVAPPAAPATSQPSTDAAYRLAPPPSPLTQDSSFAPPPPPTAAPAAPESSSPERTLNRRELRELRARQEAERAAAAPAETAVPSATAVPSETAASPEAAPKAASTPLANAAADAVPHYPYSGSAGQASKPAAEQHLTVEPTIPAYVEPPALIDPLSVVPEAAAVAAPPEDALSAFESLLANADGSAKDAEITDAPRSPLIDPPRETGSAKSAADLDFSGTIAAAPVDTSSAASAPHQSARSAESQSAEAPRSSARSTIAGLLGLAPEAASEPADTTPAVKSAPTISAALTNLSNARAEFDEQARKRLDGELPAVDRLSVEPNVTPTASLAPSPRIDSQGMTVAPAGHWTRQAAVEDDPSSSIISRTIGSGTPATSALVLPAIPFATDIRGPLNSSGETMLTGSIDLPSTLSASGVSDRFDHADIDSLLDLNDSDMVSTDSAPVRAVKAVSTFSNQSVTQTQKPKGTRALTVLLISASSMAVVVAGLLVAAFAFNML